MSAPSRIMIDGFNLALPRGTGVSTYGYNLALAIRQMGMQVEGMYGLRAPFNRKLRDIGFFESLGNDHATRTPRWYSPQMLRELSMLGRAKNARQITLDGPVVTRQFENRLPQFDRLFTSPDLFDAGVRHFKRFGTFLKVKVPNPPQIMHWTYPLPVKLAGAKNIYTLHDLVPLRLPYASLDNKKFYQKLMRACVARADHIVTVSQASADDIQRLFPMDPARLTNTYQAVGMPGYITALSDEEVASSIKSLFNLEYRGYFLFFGAVEPKKNVGRLLEAYLANSMKTPLVIVGSRAWGSESELRLLQKDELQPLKTVFKGVRRIDYLPRQLLLRLVRGAKGVVFPSLYEGFGLPALEAMALGTPVITSNTSSLPEVVGDAALSVDPYKTAEISAALRALDDNPELRAELSAKGLVQAAKFSMDAYHGRLHDMYHRILQQ